ncbi:unnamed protein product [Symbiodinium sp. CCMP2456]|nr:unnamed protein product [Symbiodinium sp. CCMP2456]
MHMGDAVSDDVGYTPVSEIVCEALSLEPEIFPLRCAVLKADFPSTFFTVHHELPTSAATFHEAVVSCFVKQEGDVACSQIAALRPQALCPFASFVLVPDWAAHLGKVVYVLDFSRCGGPAYAVCNWSHVTWAHLATIAGIHVSGQWHVFAPKQAKPLEPQDFVTAFNGDVFRFVPEGTSVGDSPTLRAKLTHYGYWGDRDVVPAFETDTAERWLFLRSHVTRTPVCCADSHEGLLRALAESTQNEPEELSFGFARHDSPLLGTLRHGRRIHGVAAGEPRPASGSHVKEYAAIAFLDPRSAGAEPSMLVCSPGWFEFDRIVRFLAVRAPPGFQPVPYGVPFVKGRVYLTHECTVAIFLRPGRAPLDAAAAPVPEPSGPSSSPIAPGHAHVGQARGIAHLPTRFDRHSEDGPTAHFALDLAEEVVAEDEQGEIVQVGFLLFSPRYAHEVVQLALRLPGALGDILSEVSSARDSAASVFFDSLTPVGPQPDCGFVALLAMPEWDDQGSVILVDARQVDGRIFALTLPCHCKRSSLLLQAEVADRPGMQVLLYGTDMTPDQLYRIYRGSLIRILPAGAQTPVALRIEDLLVVGRQWTIPCPVYPGIQDTAFWTLSDAGHKLLPIAVRDSDSSAELKEATSRAFLYNIEQTTVCPSVPRVRDASYKGRDCAAILVSTESISRLPIPPGLPLHRQHVIILDERLLLRDFSWRLAAQGVVDFDSLTQEYQAFAPEGYAININGGHPELRGQRTLLHVTTAGANLRIQTLTRAAVLIGLHQTHPAVMCLQLIALETILLLEAGLRADNGKEPAVFASCQTETHITSFLPHVPTSAVSSGEGVFTCASSDQPLHGADSFDFLQYYAGAVGLPWRYSSAWEIRIGDTRVHPYQRRGPVPLLSIVLISGLLVQTAAAWGPSSEEAQHGHHNFSALPGPELPLPSQPPSAWVSQREEGLLSLLLLGVVDVMCGNTFIRHAFVESRWCYTSVLLLVSAQLLLCHFLHCRAGKSIVCHPYRRHRIPDSPSLAAALEGVTRQENPVLRLLRHFQPDHTPGRVDDPPFQVQEPTPAADDQVDGLVNGTFAVLAIETRPDVVAVPFRVPAGPGLVTSQVQSARFPRQREIYPRILAVMPQPRQYAVFLAVPAWPTPALPVLFDCRAFSGVMHAALVPFTATREDILDNAGIDSGSLVDVWVPSQDTPLQHGQNASLFEGALVTISPVGAAPPVYWDFRAMLQSTQGWDANIVLPFSVATAYRILSDDLPARVEVEEGGRLTRAAIAEALEKDPADLTIVPALPPIRDIFSLGWTSETVFVASTLIPRHRRDPAGPKVLVIDQRPVFQGITWRLLESELLDLQQFVDDYANTCPDGYHVSVQGAPSFEAEDGTYLRIEDGRHLVVQFVLPHDQPTSEDEESDQDADLHDTTAACDSDDAAPSPSFLPHTPATDRSRSPRGSLEHDDPPLGDAASADVDPCVLCGIECAVLAPDFTPDRFQVEVQVPCPLPLFLGLTTFALFGINRAGHIGRPAFHDLYSGAPAGAPEQDAQELFDAARFVLGLFCAFVESQWCIILLLVIGGSRIGLVAIRAVTTGAVDACLPDSWAPTVRRLHYDTSIVRGLGRGPVLHVIFLACIQLASGMQGTHIRHKLPDELVARPSQRDLARSVAGRARPVPTPCRTHHSAFDSRVDSSLTGHGPGDFPFERDDLVTLLEQSVGNGAPAFMLAATCLDTLIEHFAEVRADLSSSAAGPDGGFLRLSACLPACPVVDVTAVAMHTPFTPEQIAGVLGGFWQADSELPPHISLHPATVHALKAHVSPADVVGAGIARIEVFTDGSFDGLRSAWAFAAVAHSSIGSCLFAWARGEVALVAQPWFIGVTEHSALNAERSALFWALCWLLGINRAIPRSLHSDCLVAAGQARGTFGFSSGITVASACRALTQVLETIGGFTARSISHVKGHAGHPYNELVDVLAGAQALGDSFIPARYERLCTWAVQGHLDWLWLSVAATLQPQYWPTVQGTCLTDFTGVATMTSGGLEPRDFFGPQIAAATDPAAPTAAFHIDACFVSVNVQSLCEDERSALPNRAPYVRAQLETLGCSVAGLQETRACNTTTVLSQSHIRYLSARDAKGCYGVELWFARTVPFGWIGERPIYFEPAHFRVLHWAPRLLVVRYTRGSLRIVFATCHAPSADSADRLPWWKQFVDKLLVLANGDKVVVLGDLNLRLEQELPGRVGSLVNGADSSVPEPFYRLLSGLDLWVPSTFTGCQIGPGHTWVAPGGNQVSRIDFILLPAGWHVPWGGASVLHQIDFGQTGLDHFAVCVKFEVHLQARLPFQTGKRAFDIRAACSPDSSEVIHAICEGVPRVDWTIDAHRHYHAVASHVLRGLSEHFPVSGAVCRRPFFSEKTWAFRQQRVWLRKRVHRASHKLATFLIASAWRAWLCADGLGLSVARTWGVLLRNLHSLRLSVTELRRLRPCFRQSLQLDRRQYLAEVANHAATSRTKDVVQKLRPLLGPPRRKQRGVAPLPVLTLENGDLASTPAEADARWLRHFSAVESGGPISPESLIARCYARQGGVDLEMLQVTREDLPTRWELEAAMRAAKLDRACGNDGFPADLLHLFPGQMSELFYPILMKVAFRLQEPLQFKGGTVRQIWKQKGPVDDCSSYRGILVSNVVGKTMHSAFRKKCGKWLDAVASPLQVGGRAGFPVQLAAQSARDFQTGFLRQKKSVAILFLDLREAFHRVIRPLVHGGDMADEHIAAIMQTLHLPPHSLHRFRAHIREGSLLVGAGASPWAAEVVKEFQADSWLTIGSGLAVVESGTRPGDALADVLFSFLFAAVLAKIRGQLASKGLQVRLPWSEEWFRNLEVDHEAAPDSSLSPIDVAWMDDLAVLLSAESPDALVETVCQASTFLVDACLEAFLQPNLAIGKTEILMSFAGAGSRKLRCEIFRDADPSLPLRSQLWPDARVRVVPRYRHLGGTLRWSGSLEPELRSRVAQAWQAFRKHKRQVFGSPVVSHREKALLFHSLVVSTLQYGAGSWSQDLPAVVDKVQHTLLAMARQMLRPAYDFTAACHLGAQKILAIARLPSASVLLHLERLRHLAILVRVAPADFWAIVHHGSLWCPLARDSLSWLAAQTSLNGSARPELADWASVRVFLLEAPQAWKRLVRRAQRTALLVELWQAEVQHFHGLLLRALLSAGAVSTDDSLVCSSQCEICAVCGQRFSTLRNWSHHAFKRHGRIKESRYYATGSQCAVCLKQFASTFHLSNHLDNSVACLASLVHGHQASPAMPGRNSKGFKKVLDVMLPAVVASGPRQPPCNGHFVVEAQRAHEGILSALSEIFCHPEDHPSFESLVCAARTAFCAACLQQSRLSATAKAWKAMLEEELASSLDVAAHWIDWQRRLADFLCSVDFADWLVPDTKDPLRVVATFREASVLLPWLSFDSLCLPPPGPYEPERRILVSADRIVGGCPCDLAVQWLSHASCKQQPELLDFLGWAQCGASLIVGLSVVGLLSSLSVPSPVRSYKSLEPNLASLRLFADIVRGTFFLLSKGVRAFVVSAQIDCPGLSALGNLAPVKERIGSQEVLSNFGRVSAAGFCFTSINACT